MNDVIAIRMDTVGTLASRLGQTKDEAARALLAEAALMLLDSVRGVIYPKRPGELIVLKGVKE